MKRDKDKVVAELHELVGYFHGDVLFKLLDQAKRAAELKGALSSFLDFDSKLERLEDDVRDEIREVRLETRRD